MLGQALSQAPLASRRERSAPRRERSAITRHHSTITCPHPHSPALTRPRMTITGHTQVFFILGDPVAQVRAPEVYNHLFRRHGVDAVLVPCKVAPAQLAGFVQHVFAAQNLGGLWVTIPHKAALLGLVQHSDLGSQVAGAVNAVRRHADGTLEGALFDGVGFIHGLDHFGIDVAGKRVLVVGTGGGGQAVAAALAQRMVTAPVRQAGSVAAGSVTAGLAASTTAGHLALHNRTAAKAANLAARLHAATGVSVAAVASADPAGFDLVVNCTSQGLKAGDALPFDVARLDAGAQVVDIIMSHTRTPTPLLQACAARGISAYAGFEMLVQQIPQMLTFVGLPDLAAVLQGDLSEVRTLLQPR